MNYFFFLFSKLLNIKSRFLSTLCSPQTSVYLKKMVLNNDQETKVCVVSCKTFPKDVYVLIPGNCEMLSYVAKASLQK